MYVSNAPQYVPAYQHTPAQQRQLDELEEKVAKLSFDL